jgi:hypothetical protein
MLSSSPAIPLHSIDFDDHHQRRLSLTTAAGHRIFTAQDGLPSPEHLTPISGTPGQTPVGTPPESESGSAPVSRRPSDMALDGDGNGYSSEDGTSLRKVPSRGGLWHDEVSPGRSHVLSSRSYESRFIGDHCNIGHPGRGPWTAINAAASLTCVLACRGCGCCACGISRRGPFIEDPSFASPRPSILSTPLELRSSVLSTTTSVLIGSPFVPLTPSSSRDVSS